MKLAIMQPYFFPYIGYFQAISAVDKYILYDNLPYRINSWMNKNRIAVINGGDFNIIVPISHKSPFKPISEIRINNSGSTDWRKRVLKTIYYNYKKSDYFYEIYPLLEKLLATPCNYLHQFNSNTIVEISKYLEISTEIVWDNTHYLEMEQALHETYSHLNELPTNALKKRMERIVRICKSEGATQFINAIGGQALYNKEELRPYGIDLKFVKSDLDIRYNYFSKEFIPNLSIIDVLMHNGREETKKLLKRYTLL
ncbi:MAG: WbqC family protein [Phocaeicola sp.]